MSWYPNRTVVKISGTHIPLKDSEGQTIQICPECNGKGEVRNKRAFPGCEEGEMRKCAAGCVHGLLSGTKKASETYKVINQK